MSSQKRNRRRMTVETLDVRALLAADLLLCEPAEVSTASPTTDVAPMLATYGPLPGGNTEVAPQQAMLLQPTLPEALPPVLAATAHDVAWAELAEGEPPEPPVFSLSMETFDIEADGDLWILSGSISYSGDPTTVTVQFQMDFNGSVGVDQDGTFYLVATGPQQLMYGLVSAVARVGLQRSDPMYASSP